MFHELTIRLHPDSRCDCSQGSARLHSSRARGFTLVELLVVIGIIAILMALLSPVVYQAIVRAQEARIAAEITSLDASLKAFKEKYGVYPPSDFSNMATNGPIGLFLAKAFPNCNVGSELGWITAYGGGTTLTPAQAEVFWLQGFSPDSEHPLSALNAPNTYDTGGSIALATPFFPFDTTRLVLSTGRDSPAGSAGSSTTPAIWQRFAAYVPTSGQGAPYVYFAAQNYAAGTTTAYSLAQGGSGTCRPYYQDTTNNGFGNVPVTYANPSSFQIISAGLDGNYGNGNCSFPSGAVYTAGVAGGPAGTVAYGPGDLDNITNFSNGSNLSNDVPVNQ